MIPNSIFNCVALFELNPSFTVSHFFYFVDAVCCTILLVWLCMASMYFLNVNERFIDGDKSSPVYQIYQCVCESESEVCVLGMKAKAQRTDSAGDQFERHMKIFHTP